MNQGSNIAQRNVTCGNDYTDAATFVGSKFALIVITIQNNDALVQLGRRRGGGTVDWDPAELPFVSVGTAPGAINSLDYSATPREHREWDAFRVRNTSAGANALLTSVWATA